MLTVRESSALAQVLDKQADCLRKGECYVRNVPAGQVRDAVLYGLARRFVDAVPLTLRSGADQAEYALLQVASTLGTNIVARVAAALDRGIEGAIEAVDSALGDRLLFVGGQEHLGNLLGEPSLDHV
ncbi:MAG: hypothetical protein GXP62_00375, partial [Oligoflexia bacterium]|nr:hypothetical protein [Oligoflexia bacterium]